MYDLGLDITFVDVVLAIALLVFVVFYFYKHQSTKSNPPYYKYFIYGLFAKAIAAFVFCCIYAYYYRDGDAIYYFKVSKELGGLLFNEPLSFLKIILSGQITYNDLFELSNQFDWSIYTSDKFTFFFIRLITPLNILSGGNFISCSVLLAMISYTGIWKLYVVFCEQFPLLWKELSIAILFFPSVLFWSSGLLKDTVTISALGWFVFGLHRLMNRKINFRYLFYLSLSSFVLISIKPYILHGLIVTTFIWMAVHYIRRIDLSLERLIFAPAIIGVLLVITFLLVLNIVKDQGRFDIKKKIEQNLNYSNRSSSAKSVFSMAPIDNTIPSYISHSMASVNVTLFKPYFWEANGIMLLAASFENFILFIFLLFLLIKFKFIHLCKHIYQNPFLIFSFFFIVVFSFMIGSTIDNYGTLHRFRIPMMPFYLSLCMILNGQLSVIKRSEKMALLNDAKAER